MSALGADVKIDKDVVKVTGRGTRGLKSSWRALDAGNSGTTMRLLTGILAGQNFTYEADRRCFAAEAADGARGVAAARDGRGHSRARR